MHISSLCFDKPDLSYCLENGNEFALLAVRLTGLVIPEPTACLAGNIDNVATHLASVQAVRSLDERVS